MGRKKMYIGTVKLKQKGKVYGATTRQVSALNKKSARNKLKKKYKYRNNKVVVTKLTLKKNRK